MKKMHLDQNVLNSNFFRFMPKFCSIISSPLFFLLLFTAKASVYIKANGQCFVTYKIDSKCLSPVNTV